MKVRDDNHVRNKAAHLVVGVDSDGIKHVLGIWIQNNEGAKFWLAVLTELRDHGVRDVLIACCDGLEGLPAAPSAHPDTNRPPCNPPPGAVRSPAPEVGVIVHDHGGSCQADDGMAPSSRHEG